MRTSFYFNNFIKLAVVSIFVVALSAAAQREKELTLAYYCVVDKAVYSKAPAKYERVVYRSSWGEYEIFAERQPAHEIPVSGIVSVTVGKTKKYGNSPEEQKELERIANEIVEKGKVTKPAQ